MCIPGQQIGRTARIRLGQLGRFVAEFSKTARSVTGVDISENMTQYGEKWCAELGLENTRFYTENFACADLAALGWERRFDLAFTSITPAIASIEGFENFMKIYNQHK